MTPRERVLTALKREGKPDRTPFEISWGSFTPRLMKTYREKTDFRQFFVEEELEDHVDFDEWGIGSVPTRYDVVARRTRKYQDRGLAVCGELYKSGSGRHRILRMPELIFSGWVMIWSLNLD